MKALEVIQLNDKKCLVNADKIIYIYEVDHGCCIILDSMSHPLRIKDTVSEIKELMAQDEP